MAKTKAGINGKSISLKALANKVGGSSIDAFGPDSGPLRVISINILQKDVFKEEFKKAGIVLKSNDLRDRLSKRTAFLLNELSKAALDAVKSKIPVGYRDIRSGKLRSQVRLSAGGAGNIKQFAVGTGTINLNREVIVESGPHSPIPYKGYTGKSSSLAAYLDRGNQGRTRPSEAQGEFAGVGQGESTTWSGPAINEFKAKKSSIIQSILGKFR